MLNEDFNLEEHIDYRTVLTQERGQVLNVKNEKVAYLPKIKFNYLYGHNVFSSNAALFEGDQGTDWADNIMQNFGFNISLPIITGGSRNARVQQAEIQADQVQIAKKQVEDNLKLQFATARAEYSYALESYFTQLRNVEISKKIRDTEAKKFSEGLTTSLNFTQAENQYQDALKAGIDAANNVLDKKVNLEKMLGKFNRY